MPTLHFKNKTLSCAQGDNLRNVLLEAGLTPHNGNAQWFNCKGFGTCGTCALSIEGPVSDKTARERWRLDFPPHDAQNNLRLACQCRVLGDLHLTKHEGFWGHQVSTETPEEPTPSPKPFPKTHIP